MWSLNSRPRINCLFDFQGVLRRLDYLQGLGITTIWLLPFQPSPSRDDGYDICERTGVRKREKKRLR